MSSALPQLLRLMSEIISGAMRPSSISRPTRSEAWKPSAISVCMSASFFWTNCVCGERAAELLAVERIGAGAVPAILRRAHRRPRRCRSAPG